MSVTIPSMVGAHQPRDIVLNQTSGGKKRWSGGTHDCLNIRFKLVLHLDGNDTTDCWTALTVASYRAMEQHRTSYQCGACEGITLHHADESCQSTDVIQSTLFSFQRNSGR